MGRARGDDGYILGRTEAEYDRLRQAGEALGAGDARAC